MHLPNVLTQKSFFGWVMKKILSILTLLILVLTGQEVAFNADSGTIVQQCTLDDDESSSSPDIELKKFEVGKVPLESHDITTRTISASELRTTVQIIEQQ